MHTHSSHFRCFATLFVLFAAFGAFAQGPLTNADIVRMVGLGIPADTIIRTIQTAPVVSLRVSPEFRPDLEKAGVPRVVIDAMLTRVMADESRSAAPSSASQPSQPSQPTTDTSATFQHKGSKEIGLQFTGDIPHAAPSLWTGLAELHSGYFVSRGSVVGVDLLGIFDQDAQDIYLSGYYRYYFHTGNPKFFPFFGGSGGGNILHIRGNNTATNFVARGEAGVRYFVAKHVALDVGYNLVYIHVRGLGFKDSSTSQIGVGFSTVF